MTSATSSNVAWTSIQDYFEKGLPFAAAQNTGPCVREGVRNSKEVCERMCASVAYVCRIVQDSYCILCAARIAFKRTYCIS
jgi:hypothetical protein